MNVALKYGLVSGLSICLWTIATYLCGYHTATMEMGKYSLLGLLIIPFLFTIFCLFTKKKEFVLTWSVSLQTALAISLVSGMIGVLFACFYFNFIHPELVQEWMYMESSRLIKMGYTQKAILLRMAELEKLYELNFFYTLCVLGVYVLLGIVSGLLGGLFFVEKEKKLTGSGKEELNKYQVMEKISRGYRKLVNFLW